MAAGNPLLFNMFGWDTSLPEGGGMSDAQKWQTGLFALAGGLDRMGLGQPQNIGRNYQIGRSTYQDQNAVARQRTANEAYLGKADLSGTSQTGLDAMKFNMDQLPVSPPGVPGMPVGPPQQRVAGGALPTDPEMQSRVPEVRPLRKGEEIPDPSKPGSMMSEKTMSFGDSKGVETLIPSVWMTPDGAKEVDPNTARAYARAYEQRWETRFPKFQSIPEAEAASKSRSAKGGVAVGPLAQPTERRQAMEQQVANMLAVGQGQDAPHPSVGLPGGAPVPQRKRRRSALTKDEIAMLKTPDLMTPKQVSAYISKRVSQQADEDRAEPDWKIFKDKNQLVRVNPKTGRTELIHTFPTKQEMSKWMKIAKERYPDDKVAQQKFFNDMIDLERAEIQAKINKSKGIGTKKTQAEKMAEEQNRLFGPGSDVIYKTFGKENMKYWAAADSSMTKFFELMNAGNEYKNEFAHEYEARTGKELPKHIWSVQTSPKGAETMRSMPKGTSFKFNSETGDFEFKEGVGVGGDGGDTVGGKSANEQVMQKVAVSAQALRDTYKSFEPWMLTWGGKIGSGLSEFMEKAAGVELSPKDADDLSRITTFLSNAGRYFVETLRTASGVAVTKPEARRASIFIPKGGTLGEFWTGDSSTVFMSKLRGAMKWNSAVMARRLFFKKAGINFETANFDSAPLAIIRPGGTQHDLFTIKDFVSGYGRFRSVGKIKDNRTGELVDVGGKTWSQDRVIDAMSPDMVKQALSDWANLQKGATSYGDPNSKLPWEKDDDEK